MTQDKVLAKLAKLKAGRDGEAAIGNQAAADAFASMINSMLLKHELSEAEIPVAGAKEDPIVEQLVDPRKIGLKFSRVRVGWQERLAGIIAAAHLCKLLVHSGTNYITLVGTREHVAVAEYAYGVLCDAAERMSKHARDAYWKAHRDDPDFESGNFRASWLRGFIGRIDERFDEARRKEVQATGNAGTAMIRLDQALVRAAKYIDDMKGVTKAAPVTIGRGCAAGERAGRQAADGMAIGQKGVEGGARRALK